MLFNLSVAIKPPPKMTISEWAEKERFLSAESSASPGKWKIKKAEYLRGIMEAISDDNIEEIVFMSSAQTGKTEGPINNTVGYYIEHEPCPIMVVQPTMRPMGEAYSKDRLSPMLRDTPCLRGLVKEARSRDSENTILHKVFPGGHITISGANSPASLASRPIRILLLDEIDRYPASAGAEGDPVLLATKRTITFWNRKIIKTSTPTIKDNSRIEKDFLETDQRYFYVPCVHCGQFQVLKWANVVWQKDEKKVNLPETAIYACDFCGVVWDNLQRWEAVQKGVWRATAKSKSPKKVGFHIWAAYASWVELEDLARDFLSSYKDKELLQVFTNTVLGESFEDLGAEKIESENILLRIEDYPEFIPAGVLLLTCAVDIQKDRIEIEIKGWGKGQECWAIEYTIFHGSTDEGGQVWDKLEEHLKRTFKHERGLYLKIACTCIDSGYQTDTVYKFCKKCARLGLRVYAIKGRGDLGRPIVAKPTKEKKYGIKLFIIGTNMAKDRINYRLGITKPGNGFMHFPSGGLFDIEYFNQLTAETKLPKFIKGFKIYEWHKKKSQRNEALDITVYNFAALGILNPNFEKIENSFIEKLNIGKSNKKEKHSNIKSSFVNDWNKH